MPIAPPVEVAIIGAGIAGLSAAYELALLGCRNLAVLEASSRAGGVIRTQYEAGFVFEGGPDSFLTEKRAGIELCRELGLEAQLVGSNDAQRETRILRRGRLLPLPEGWQFLAPARLWPAARTPLLSWRAKLRISREIIRPPHPAAGDQDESIAAFVGRHFGHEVLEYIAAPLLAAVYGGDAHQLSVRAVLPRFAELEQQGSLVRALMRRRRPRGSSGGASDTGPRPRAAEPGASGDEPAAGNAENAHRRSLFTTLAGGMQTLIDALVERVGPRQIRLNCAVARLAASGDGYVLRTAAGELLQAGAVILALPAWTTGELLRDVDAGIAQALALIPYASSMIVALAFETAPRLPGGFGFLVPRSEGKRMLACTFVHSKFAGRAPAGAALLRSFYGGTIDGNVLALSDDEAVDLARRELREILGIEAQPASARVQRWPRAMAQYTVGHLERLRAINAALERHPRLHLAGNAYRGIGVPDCIASGRAAARKVWPP